MSQEVQKATPPAGLAIICNTIKKMDVEFKAALPANISPEKFIKTAVTAIQMHPQKDKLANADRQSLYNACTKAAADGLVLDGREAALVVFGDQVQYMPMVQGMVKLARNSGEIANIIAEVVYKNDKFSYRIGLDASPVHEPDWFGDDRGEPVGAWALITLKNGEKIPAILPKKKIMNIAAKTKNANQYNPQQGPYFDEWWKKTAVKNVLKYAPKSSEIDRLISADEEEHEMVDAETGEVTVEKKAKRGRTAAAVKAAVETPQAEEVKQDETETKTIDVTPEKVEEPKKTFRAGDNVAKPESVEEEIPL